MDTNLQGRVAVVTGAGQGIGLGIAICLAREGAVILVNDLVQERADAAVKRLKQQGAQAIGVIGDVARSSDMDRLAAEAIDRYGRIDILVNNAGTVISKHVLDQTEADWDRVVDINLKGTFLACRSVLPHMVKQRRGAIVNIASMAPIAYHGVHHVPYTVSKAGVITLTRDLAFELGRYGIRVNCIAPGAIRTELLEATLTAEQKAAISAGIVLGRLGTPEDIGNATVYLVSDFASYVTGHTLCVSGGSEARIGAEARS